MSASEPDASHQPPQSPHRAREPVVDRSQFPRASVNAVIGLLEILDEVGGKDDVFRLAAAIHYSLTEIHPITEGAELLGFVSVDQGDIVMTPLGKIFVDADVNARKKMFRDRLKQIPPFHHIMAALKRRRGNRMKDDVTYKFLREHIAPGEVQDVFEHLIEWGRYGELIGYDPDEHVIYLDQES